MVHKSFMYASFGVALAFLACATPICTTPLFAPLLLGGISKPTAFLSHQLQLTAI
jgi:hypothetical protein